MEDSGTIIETKMEVNYCLWYHLYHIASVAQLSKAPTFPKLCGAKDNTVSLHTSILVCVQVHEPHPQGDVGKGLLVMLDHWGSPFFTPKAKKQIHTTNRFPLAAAFKGLKKDMAIQRWIVLNAEVENNDRPKMKYKYLAIRLSEKVAKYEDEQDKLKYLRAVA